MNKKPDELRLKIRLDALYFEVIEGRDHDICQVIILIFGVLTTIGGAENIRPMDSEDAVGRVFNHHSLAFGNARKLGGEVKNLRMGFGFFELGTADFCFEEMPDIKALEHPADGIHRGGRRQNHRDTVHPVIFKKGIDTWQKLKFGIVVKEVFKVLSLDFRNLFNGLGETKFLD